jgi:AraC family carnitine catabolism transcriptional activator
MHQVVFVLFPGFSMISLNGALEPLRVANLLKPEAYAWTLLSPGGEPTAASNDIPVSVAGPFRHIGAPDLVVLCSSYEPLKAVSAPVIAEIRRLAGAGVVLCAIESAPLIMAAPGVLDGHRATCHWECTASMREEFPEVEVCDSLYEMDRRRMTCAVGASVIDMMLEWIARREGSALSAAIADKLIHTRYVETGEEPRVPARSRYQVNDPRLLAIIDAMETHTEDTLQICDLAEIGDLSPRQLERLFRARLGTTPKQFYLKLRLERAERLLTYSNMSVRDVGLACGFSSLSQFSRAYKVQFGVPPSAARRAA